MVSIMSVYLEFAVTFCLLGGDSFAINIVLVAVPECFVILITFDVASEKTFNSKLACRVV